MAGSGSERKMFEHGREHLPGGPAWDADGDPARLRALLEERTERLARRPVESAPRVPLLTLCIGDERYGLAFEHIGGLVGRAVLTPVPGAPPELAGLLLWRGELAAVVDLGRLLGMGAARKAGGTVVLLRHPGRRVGLLVDAAEGAVQLDQDALAAAREHPHALVRGLVGGRLAVLDADALAAALNERNL